LRIFLVEDQFVDIDGHYLHECMAWRGAAEMLGLDLDIFASRGLDAGVAAQVDAHRTFLSNEDKVRRCLPPSGEMPPIQRYFTDFLSRSYAISEGCRRMNEAAGGEADVVMFTFADAAVLNGAAEWLVDLPPEQRPTVVFNFHRPEITFQPGAGRTQLSGLAGLVVASAHRIRALMPPGKVLLTAVDPRLAALLEGMLGLGCLYSPMAQHFGVKERPDAGGGAANPVVSAPIVSAMGMARATKGGEKLAAIAFHLFAERPDVRFFIQCLRPSAAEYFRNVLKKANCKRELDISLKLSSDQYYEQVARSDLILLPYSAQIYAFQSSGVFSDAVGAGVPVVVPAETWMSDRLQEGFGAGVIFPDERPQVIARSIVAALDALPRLKASAASSAARWREAHSAQRYLEFVLKNLGDVEAVERSRLGATEPGGGNAAA
jgi:hypothetical protein